MASGGQITPGGAQMWESQFSVAQLQMIVSHAASHGLPVAAHAHGADAIEACVEAGVSTIEHCTWMVGPGQIERRDEVAKRMVARGIAACSTSSPSWRAMAERMGPDVAGRVFGRLRWMEDQGVPPDRRHRCWPSRFGLRQSRCRVGNVRMARLSAGPNPGDRDRRQRPCPRPR
ncbi:MAG TPA: amidohydrolase family protein [Pseudonocardiaceae bacterium]|nr:amidohydrolase family protein [Pseudonocardiaceae bacterium]